MLLNVGMFLLLTCSFLTPVATQNLTKRQLIEEQDHIWTAIKRDLTGPDGPKYFKENIEGMEIPGGAGGLYEFAATVLSSRSLSDGYRAVILAVSDKTTPEVELRTDVAFNETLPPKTEARFSGVCQSFRKDPFILNVTATRFHKITQK